MTGRAEDLPDSALAGGTTQVMNVLSDLENRTVVQSTPLYPLLNKLGLRRFGISPNIRISVSLGSFPLLAVKKFLGLLLTKILRDF